MDKITFVLAVTCNLDCLLTFFTVSQNIDDGTYGVVTVFKVAEAGAVDVKLPRKVYVNAILFAINNGL